MRGGEIGQEKKGNLEILPEHREFYLLKASCKLIDLKYIHDIAIFAVKFFKSILYTKLSQISEIGTGKISNWTGKTQNLQLDLSGDLDCCC